MLNNSFLTFVSFMKKGKSNMVHPDRLQTTIIYSAPSLHVRGLELRTLTLVRYVFLSHGKNCCADVTQYYFLCTSPVLLGLS